MQALIATSRSISQDVFLERENKRKYDQHLSKVESIKHLKDFPAIQQVRQVQRLTKTLYKHKESAKTFREHEQKTQIKRENRLLLEKIWKINPSIKTDSNVMHLQHQSGSNWMLKKKQAQLIKQENKRLGINILSTKVDTKQYKKKLQNEIKEYLELRNNIRKFNTQRQRKKLQRAQSEKKGFKIKLKLKDEQQVQNNEISQKGVEDEKIKKQLDQKSKSKIKKGQRIPSQKLVLIGQKKQAEHQSKNKNNKEDKQVVEQEIQN